MHAPGAGPALPEHGRQVVCLYAAFIGFGLASWVMANGLFIELSALYTRVPEGEDLGAYIILSLQCSNVLPILFMLFNRHNQYVSLHLSIGILLAVGMVVSVLLALFWDDTSHIAGGDHATALLVLVFCCGLVSSTTSVVFYPFVAEFPRVYTSALATGEGLSGTLMGIVGLLQNAGGDLRFSVSVFFVCMGLVMALAAASFAFLLFHPWAAQARREGRSPYSTLPRDPSLNLSPEGVPPSPAVPPASRKALPHTLALEAGEQSALLPAPPLHVRDVWRLLALQAVVSSLAFGVVPSVMPIVCDAYRSGSVVLMWSSVLSMTCDPLSRFVTSFRRSYNVPLQVLLVSVLAAFVVALTVQVPQPLLHDRAGGGALPVALNCVFVAGYAYANTMIYISLKRDVPHDQQPTAYQWSGFATQIGASVGTAITFTLVTKGVL